MVDCHAGRGKTALTPPPVLPPLSARKPSPSFHTTSPSELFCDSTVVPPTESTYGLELGKSACACPSPTASLEPSSPAATLIVMPRYAASFRLSLSCVI